MEELFQIIYKWRKYIFGLTFFAVVLSCIITMPVIMPPYYESKMVLYVSNPLSTDRANLFNQENVGNISMFGSRDDADRFISIAQSSQVIMQILQKYQLSSHYKIKQKSTALIEYYTKKEFSSNYKILRNDADAIEISIQDENANLAAKMVKDLVNITDAILKNIYKKNKKKVLDQINQLIETKKLESNSSIEEKESMIKLNELKNQYSISINDDFNSIYIIEDAAVAVKKSKPVRWQIVLLSCVAAFISATLLAIVFEQIQHARKK